MPDSVHSHAIATGDQRRPFALPRLLQAWGLSIACALVINIVLFCLMPGLVQTVPDRPMIEDVLKGIQVIRIKRQDTAVVKKEHKPPPKQEEKEVKPRKKEVALSKPVRQKIRLPFELNTRLPAGPQTLAMPSLDKLALSAFSMEDAYGVDALDAPLVPLVKIPPVYPMRASRLSIEGWVSVRFLVTEEGQVDHIEILAADPEDMFERSVLACVSKWRFKPGTIEGIPVKTWVETTIRFRLEES